MASRLKRMLLGGLDAALGGAGFGRVSDRLYGDRYVREAGGIRHTVHVDCGALAGRLVVEVPSVSIRFNRVEELVAQSEERHPLLVPEDIAARATLSVALDGWRLGWLWRKRWTVRDEARAARVPGAVAAYARRKGEPVFAELSRADAALRILAADDDDARKYSAPDECRAEKAICMALLCNGPDAARRLAEAKLAKLTGEARSTAEAWLERFWRKCKGRRNGKNGRRRRSSVIIAVAVTGGRG